MGDDGYGLLRSRTFQAWAGVLATVIMGVAAIVVPDMIGSDDDDSATHPPPSSTAPSTASPPPPTSTPPSPSASSAEPASASPTPSSPSPSESESASEGPSDPPTVLDPPSPDSTDPFLALDEHMTGVYDIDVPNAHYLDVDGEAISNVPGPAHDLYYSTGWLAPSSGVKLGVIDDANVPKCSTRARLQQGSLYMNMMKPDQSLCVHTSEGRWTLLQGQFLPEGSAYAGTVRFHVGYLKNP
ncbi:hypothetical protein LRS74_21690 [Streptomyces sp. LX-29]|uniref:hypothetical protein n=1 Tax=Streptomyces sp. LX-29 TaxID=2900152 RepID=UPI00240E8D92|nr:hypothetical protein [Streptomyces sp. LX-29]WFB09363.1 hypothetical protein LRS74_21690 [Streptomyces sp. LX-29]